MTIRVGINGLGRIGRCVMRAIVEHGYDDIEIVAANGPAPTPTHVHLLKYDSVHGVFRGEVSAEGDRLNFGGREVTLVHERDPAKLDWAKLGVDVVLECTGKFTRKADAAIHLARGAKRVILSAPAKDECTTIVYGVNNAALKKNDEVVSVGSCTTNCLAPVAKILSDTFGIESAFMTTIHAYTGDQNLVDGSHEDLRRARAATLSMVPSKTGAAKAIGLVLPELAGKMHGVAVRVPTPNVSMVDLTFNAAKPISKETINAALQAAATGPMKGVMETTDLPLVSVDFVHHPASAIVDLTGTHTIGQLGRVAAWYDNEWGFSCRMLDVTRLVARA